VKFENSHVNSYVGKIPDWSDWYARKPSGTMKKIPSQSSPGPRRR
jgi:hypothetical protein